MIEPVKRSSIREQVFKQLERQIISGSWLPGTKIPSEHELASMMGVSRVTVREALQKLNTLGLLEARRGEGTYVKELSVDACMNSLLPLLLLDTPEIMYVLEYRKVVETASMELVVERATEDDIERLKSILEEMVHSKENIKRFAEKDLDFHLALAEITKNPVIIKVNHVLKGILDASMDYIVQCLGTYDGLYYHDRIINAIKDRDKEKAQQLMMEHIMKTIERIDLAEKNAANT